MLTATWKICFFSEKKNLGTGKSKRVEADFQAQEQVEGNQPLNILRLAFTPSALNALPREAQITVIRGNNSQSGVFFGDASALSKIILVLHGEVHFSSECDAAGGSGGMRAGDAGAAAAPRLPGSSAGTPPLEVK